MSHRMRLFTSILDSKSPTLLLKQLHIRCISTRNETTSTQASKSTQKLCKQSVSSIFSQSMKSYSAKVSKNTSTHNSIQMGEIAPIFADSLGPRKALSAAKQAEKNAARKAVAAETAMALVQNELDTLECVTKKHKNMFTLLQQINDNKSSIVEKSFAQKEKENRKKAKRAQSVFSTMRWARDFREKFQIIRNVEETIKDCTQRKVNHKVSTKRVPFDQVAFMYTAGFSRKHSPKMLHFRKCDKLGMDLKFGTLSHSNSQNISQQRRYIDSNRVIVVDHVHETSRAAQCGVQPGDIIHSIAGVILPSQCKLENISEILQVATWPFDITLYRGVKTVEYSIPTVNQ